MRPIPFASVLTCLTIAASALPGQEPSSVVPEHAGQQAPEVHRFGHCGPDGRGGDPALNFLKNRVDTVTHYVAVTFQSIAALTWPRPVQKRVRDVWSIPDSTDVARYESTPIVVEAYLTYDERPSRPVTGTKEEGPESTNCGLGDHAHVDWHIWMTEGPHQDRRHAIVIEITPRVRHDHPGWDINALHAIGLHGVHVRVSGWLLLDQEHPEQIGKTRGTLWEIHPVMKFEVEESPNHWVKLEDWTP